MPASIRPSLFRPKPYQPSRASGSGTEDGAFVLVARGRSPDITRCERRGPGYVRPFREMLEPCRCRRKCCGFKTQNFVGNRPTSGRHLVPSLGGEECLRLEFSSTLVLFVRPPLHLSGASRISHVKQQTLSTTNLDSSNLRILRELQTDFRVSNVELAPRVHLSLCAQADALQDGIAVGLIRRPESGLRPGREMAAAGHCTMQSETRVKGASSAPCSHRKPTRATGSCPPPSACVPPCGRAAR